MAIFAYLDTAVTSRPYRVLLAIFGGYAFTVGFFAFLSVVLALLGATRVEGMWWGVLTSFLVYTLVVVWVAATRRPGLATFSLAISSIGMIIGSPPLAKLLEV